MSKKIFLSLIVVLLLFSLIGCSEDAVDDPNEGEPNGEEALRAILLIPGELGDKSFFDAANNGMALIEENLEAEIKVVEMGTESTAWEPNFLDAIEGGYDIIISGNDTTELMNELATDYPDQMFINFDTSETENQPENVYSMFYTTNDLSFMAGAAAALITNSDMELANEEKIIGFLGGMDIPGINDFLVGYIQGAQHVDPEIKMFISYAGDFGDPAKGKELTLIQYNSGADVSFNVAGGTGLGLLDAAYETDNYAIGVDSDQAMLFAESEPEKAAHIVTSAVKYIDQAIFRAVEMHVEGTLPYGTHEELGVAEGGVGLAKNTYYETLLSEEIKAELNDIEQLLVDGEITVDSAFGMSSEEINEIRDSVSIEN
ncbi:MAG: BMP family ABC transporter substrate-binding protein [Clostridia bacterium]